jgi:hypothetical protein
MRCEVFPAVRGPDFSAANTALVAMFALLARFDVHGQSHGFSFHATENDPKEILSSMQGRR